MNLTIQLEPGAAAILGALIADSASLGLHWLYDSERIASIEKEFGLTFLQPNAAYYADKKGFFAHGHKQAGDGSGYGELCLLLLQHIARHGRFDRVAYQSEFCAHFGPGGTFVGYIDAPTRLTLRTLLSLPSSEYPEYSGADDDQFAALATVPVLVVTHQGTPAALMERVENTVRITNHNNVAVAAAQYAAMVLFEILKGAAATQAFTRALPFAGEQLRPLLEQALAISTFDSVGIAARFGSACHVMQGLPIIAHIAQHTSDYRSAIEANIRAGGDSCGRAIMLGAIIAAQAAKQNTLASAIPLTWMARYRKLTDVANACARI